MTLKTPEFGFRLRIGGSSTCGELECVFWEVMNSGK